VYIILIITASNINNKTNSYTLSGVKLNKPVFTGGKHLMQRHSNAYTYTTTLLSVYTKLGR